jgi:hypothetical protein
VELHALSVESSGTTLMAGEADLTHSADIRIEPSTILLGPGEERIVTGTIAVAKGKATRGQNLTCVISASVMDQPVHTEVYSHIRTRAR